MNASQVELVDARHEFGDVGVLRVQIAVAVATATAVAIVVVVMLVNIVALSVVVVVMPVTAEVALHPEVMVRGGYVRLEAVLQLILYLNASLQ